MTVKVVKTRGAEEFGFCAVLELVAESRGPHAAREAMAVAELAPSKDSADLRVRRGLRVACGCEPACGPELTCGNESTCGRESACGHKFAAAELCIQRCFMATSFKEMRAGSYGVESKKLIA